MSGWDGEIDDSWKGKQMSIPQEELDADALQAAIEAYDDTLDLDVPKERLIGNAISAYLKAIHWQADHDTLVAAPPPPPAPSEDGEAVAWQRRLMNPTEDISGIPAGQWGAWKECTPEQAAYAIEFGIVEGFGDRLMAQARPVYAVTPPLDVRAVAIEECAKVVDGKIAKWSEWARQGAQNFSGGLGVGLPMAYEIAAAIRALRVSAKL